MLFMLNDKPLVEALEQLDAEMEVLADKLYDSRIYNKRVNRHHAWEKSQQELGCDPDGGNPLVERIKHVAAEIRTMNKRIR